MSKYVDFKSIFRHAMEQKYDYVYLTDRDGGVTFNLYSNGVLAEYPDVKGHYMEAGRVYRYHDIYGNLITVNKFNKMMNDCFKFHGTVIVTLVSHDGGCKSYKFKLD